MSEPGPNLELPKAVESTQAQLPERPKVPEIGDNPKVDALRHLPDTLGFTETTELTAERMMVADWLMTHAAEVEYALDTEEDTPELAALQQNWGRYAVVSEEHVDRFAGEGGNRERALVGMLLDHALIYYDSGLTHQFWERMEDIVQSVEGYGLEASFPEIIAAAHLD